MKDKIIEIRALNNLQKINLSIMSHYAQKPSVFPYKIVNRFLLRCEKILKIASRKEMISLREYCDQLISSWALNESFFSRDYNKYFFKNSTISEISLFKKSYDYYRKIENIANLNPKYDDYVLTPFHIADISSNVIFDNLYKKILIHILLLHDIGHSFIRPSFVSIDTSYEEEKIERQSKVITYNSMYFRNFMNISYKEEEELIPTKQANVSSDIDSYLQKDNYININKMFLPALFNRSLQINAIF